MDIRAISSYEELIDLEQTWCELLGKCDHTIFSTWDWVSIWWKHFGKNRKLLILVAEEGNNIVGIAPLMYCTETVFKFSRSKLEFIGTPDSDYNNLIISKEYSNTNEVFDQFIKYLNKMSLKWTFLNLMELPKNAACLNHLKRISNLKPITKCSCLSLPQSYEEFLKNLSYKQRGSVNNSLSKIKKTFASELVECSQSSSCSEGMQDLIDLHQKRWRGVGLAGAFSDKAIENFHLEVADKFVKKKMLGLYILKFDGKPVSGSYGFKYLSKYYAYLPGFDPAYSKFGVGSILVPYLVDKFIKDGLTEFDFMRGDEGYKERWNAVPSWNYQAILYKQSSVGGFDHKLYNYFWNKSKNFKIILKKRSLSF